MRTGTVETKVLRLAPTVIALVAASRAGSTPTG